MLRGHVSEHDESNDLFFGGFGSWPVPDHLASVKYDNSVGYFPDVSEVVADDEHGLALAFQLADQLEHPSCLGYSE